jgi:hypothetical protein
MSENLIEASEGRPWAAWQQSAHLARATWITPDQLLPAGRRLVLLAPHPDDEILPRPGANTACAANGHLKAGTPCNSWTWTSTGWTGGACTSKTVRCHETKRFWLITLTNCSSRMTC